PEHEWLKVEDNIATVGITSHAAEQLGDIVFVELPEIGQHFSQGDEVAVVESVKAASDIYAPIDGTIIEVNTELESTPEQVNTDPQGTGWFFKMEIDNKDQINGLMGVDSYMKLLKEEL
ncbi:MAG TPA: glycine cleavage system protein GcvH, partial [Hellea balneolensis]|nr:glycine cleavage system protein GcvH [Hellea balneolensis]